jgi:hypothetical protein
MSGNTIRRPVLRAVNAISLLKIHCAPRKLCQIAEPLAEIESEKHEAAPFDIVAARFQDALDFRERETAPRGFVARFKNRHAHSQIDREQALPNSLAEADAQNFQAQICSRAGKFFCFTITKPRDVHGLQRREIAVAFTPDEINEPFDDACVTRMRGRLSFDGFRLQPRLAPLLYRSTWQRFDVGRRENITDATRNHFTGSVRTQLAIASEQRGSVPRAADFERLFPIASFRGTKDALAGVGIRIED